MSEKKQAYMSALLRC